MLGRQPLWDWRREQLLWTSSPCGWRFPGLVRGTDALGAVRRRGPPLQHSSRAPPLPSQPHLSWPQGTQMFGRTPVLLPPFCVWRFCVSPSLSSYDPSRKSLLRWSGQDWRDCHRVPRVNRAGWADRLSPVHLTEPRFLGCRRAHPEKSTQGSGTNPGWKGASGPSPLRRWPPCRLSVVGA